MFLVDLDDNTEFYLPTSTYIGGDKNSLSLREIKNRLEVKYCMVSLLIKKVYDNFCSFHQIFPYRRFIVNILA